MENSDLSSRFPHLSSLLQAGNLGDDDPLFQVQIKSGTEILMVGKIDSTKLLTLFGVGQLVLLRKVK